MIKDTPTVDAELLKAIYFEALERCRPSLLVQRARSGEFSDVIALGKCAAEMVRGVMATRSVNRCFAVMPRGYAGKADFPAVAEVHFGSHPELSADSFVAGEALVAFVNASRSPLLVLISGGSSACVEVPLRPWFSRDDLIATNHALIGAGWPIARINAVRRHLSAIKGGRLGAMLPRGSRALIISDVNIGHPELVGSGPTYPDLSTNAQAAQLLRELGIAQLAERLSAPEVADTPKESPIESRIVGDNETLTRAAADAAHRAGYQWVFGGQVLGDVERAAQGMFESAMELQPGTVWIAGGEPTVRVARGGRGGRCFEVAARLARLMRRQQSGDIVALIGSSDGRDGNSGAAGCVVSGERVLSSTVDVATINHALDDSDTLRLAEKIGEPIIIPPTGNNLRDLFLLTRI